MRRPVAVEDAPVAQQLQGTAVDTAVLSDLKAEGVEAEGLHLPAEVEQVAIRDPAEALGDERVPQLVQDTDERPGCREAAVARRIADQVATGPTQALLDEREPLAVGLLREASTHVGGGLRQVVLVARQLRPEEGTQPTGGGIGRDGLGQPVDDGLVPPQHVVGLDAQGLAGDRRRDVGIAIAVATDPGPPLHEGAHSRRPGPGHARVTCRGQGWGAAAVERVIEHAVQAGRHHEQGLVEERHRAADLVERCRRWSPAVARCARAG